MLGRNRILFFENGVVSFNLPIASQVVGTRATRTTHPRVLYDLGRFLTALLTIEVKVDNPFIWMTKAEVAKLIAARGHADLIRHSVSCSRVHAMTKLYTHCGTCSQCLDRRFATLSAGLDEEDPTEMYFVDLLTGARDEGAGRTMAEAFVRRALEFRRMTRIGFLGKYAGEISRAARCFPGVKADEVAQRAFELHQRLGDAVHSVLANGVRAYASELIDQTLPASSVLRMAVAEHQASFDETPIKDPAEVSPRRAEEGDTRDYRRSSEIRMALDERKHRVLFEGVPPIEGKANCSLVERLATQYREDLQAGRVPENYQYVRAVVLASALSVEEPTLRRRVNRFRQAVCSQFEEHCGLPLTKDAIIETKEWSGYRLNPSVRLVDPGQVTVAERASRLFTTKSHLRLDNNAESRR